MSRNIGGKKFRPPTWTSTVDATVSSNASARSASRTGSSNRRSAWARTSFKVLTIADPAMKGQASAGPRHRRWLPFGDPSRGRRLVKVLGWLAGTALLVAVLALFGVDVEGWFESLWDALTGIGVGYLERNRTEPFVAPRDLPSDPSQYWRTVCGGHY